jgi:hypothetical protein
MSIAPDPSAHSSFNRPAPIIVTAMMGAADFAWADALRRTHFPPERNWLRAHITLFHHLPPGSLSELMRLLRQASAAPPPPARLAAVISLGRGVAYRLESSGLLDIRGDIAEAFGDQLTPQDRQQPRLHITVQNKVDLAVAKALHGELSRAFRPRPFSIVGLAAHYYRGGPWEPIGHVKFRGHSRT